MYNVIINGTGLGYNRCLNLIKYFELSGKIQVLGVIGEDNINKKSLDGYKLFKRSEISQLKFDYCIMTQQSAQEIHCETRLLGIPRASAISSRILEIPHFDFEKYIALKKEGITILPRNCWAGICYHSLDLEFQSPTINMFFNQKDFNKFVTNLDYYLSLPMLFDGTRYQEALKINYPVGRLGDIQLHFNHTSDFDRALLDWNRRKERIKDNKIIISFSTRAEDVIEFIKLPYLNKLIFIPESLKIKSKSVYPLPFHPNDNITIGEYSNALASGFDSKIDLLSLLSGSPYNRYN